MAEASPGKTLVSRTVKDLVVGSGIAFTPAGRRTLKGISEDWDYYGVKG
ncbi:hypothetical protein [Taklimakanibacter albus]|jgi:class 3 adenylate cyclase|uniref:Uncharacterized protein n=1 Tax=Taklimakanibacter albus TaxID=2800327 RepID=A0ACC5RC64_9HYPH|nr:hypothetical protein [Aestuariivirga sp. YIM B02566]MBK1870232.1 hypothetical protein [Aestuariivirga sp. YIM B02566]